MRDLHNRPDWFLAGYKLASIDLLAAEMEDDEVATNNRWGRNQYGQEIEVEVGQCFNRINRADPWLAAYATRHGPCDLAAALGTGARPRIARLVGYVERDVSSLVGPNHFGCVDSLRTNCERAIVVVFCHRFLLQSARG